MPRRAAQRPAQRPAPRTEAPEVAPTRPMARPEGLGAGGRAPGAARGNAAVQEQVGTADPVAAPAQQDPRSQAVEAYGRRLWDVIGELMLMDDTEQKASSARAVIGQAVEVQRALQIGQTVEVDLLPRIPLGDQGPMPTAAFPPQWIQPTRMLLQMAGGTGASPRFQPEGGDAPATLWEAGQHQPTGRNLPWAGSLESLKTIGRRPADYGVNGYQTQSNNLASPEATCNGTSLAMVLERLGYTREDLIEAIETRLKRNQYEASLRARRLPRAEFDKQMAEFDPSCVALTTDAWKNRVLAYLREENGRGSGYQRLRGATQSDRQMQTWAGQFRDNAGMDDLALFVMDLLGIERTTVNAGNNPERLVSFVHEGSGTRTAKPTTERLDAGTGWTRIRERLKTCLEDGGAAMLSIRHKGAGSSATHIVAVQNVEPGGVLVDDPYGGARSDYRGNRRGDAYARPGSTRRASGLRNEVQADPDDWKMSAPVTGEERRGESTFWTDDLVRTSLNYVVLFHRGRAAATTGTGAAAAAATGTGTGTAAAGGATAP